MDLKHPRVWKTWDWAEFSGWGNFGVEIANESVTFSGIVHTYMRPSYSAVLKTERGWQRKKNTLLLCTSARRSHRGWQFQGRGIVHTYMRPSYSAALKQNEDGREKKTPSLRLLLCSCARRSHRGWQFQGRVTLGWGSRIRHENASSRHRHWKTAICAKWPFAEDFELLLNFSNLSAQPSSRVKKL